ncbi:hypothetical protein [Enterobacter ludwigii]|uniref:hypothetical protein n=1 Tax=Enterobacter ludwigii TaxID=299767 RepID=UPI0039770B8B
MKLIDILVSELPNLGGWPDGVIKMSQDYDGEVWCWRGHGYGNFNSFARISEIADNHRKKSQDEELSCFVTREQYEAALAASKPEWDGEGLPPVGCECELSNAVEFYTHSGSTDFDEGTTVVVGGTVNFGLGDFVAVKVKGTNCITDINPCFLRPARPEAVRKRDEAVKEFVRQLIECVDLHAMDKRQDAIVREKLYSMLPTLPGVTVID